MVIDVGINAIDDASRKLVLPPAPASLFSLAALPLHLRLNAWLRGCKRGVLAWGAGRQAVTARGCGAWATPRGPAPLWRRMTLACSDGAWLGRVAGVPAGGRRGVCRGGETGPPHHACPGGRRPHDNRHAHAKHSPPGLPPPPPPRLSGHPTRDSADTSLRNAHRRDPPAAVPCLAASDAFDPVCAQYLLAAARCSRTTRASHVGGRDRWPCTCLARLALWTHSSGGDSRRTGRAPRRKPSRRRVWGAVRP